MSEKPMTVLSIADRIPDEAAAYEFLEELRWNGKPVCPHCGNDDKSYYLAPKAPTGRQTRTGSVSQRRVWKCAACRKQFSVLTGTIFHGTKISVRIWVFVIFEMCSSKNGVAAREIERKYGLTPKSAWFMTHRIREAMRRDPLAGMLSGTIVADETFIGGKPKNRHRQGTYGKVRYGAGSKSGPEYQKIPVLTLVDKATGETRSAVVTDVSGHNLRKAIAEQVDMGNSVLHTDAAGQYRQLGQEFIDHQWVDHSSYEYVRGEVSTNAAESFFAQLKRSIDGTHHHVSRKHLPRYLAEFDFRSTTHKMPDGRRMRILMGQMPNRRLSYKPLTAE